MTLGNAIRRLFDSPASRCKRVEPSLSPRIRLMTAQRDRTRGSLNGEGGASLVETALACTAILGLFFGVMQMSLALYSYHFTSDAAREGTRYAMVRGCSVISSSCPASAKASDVQTYVRGLGFPGIVSANITVTTTWPTTGATCTPSSLPCNNPGNLVHVTVKYTFPLSIPFMKSTTLTMASTSQMAISQ